MSPRRHILLINEFFHPDVCASASVLTDRLPRIAASRPDCRITVIAGNRAWNGSALVYPAEDEYRGVRIIRVDRPALSRTNLVRRAMGFAAFGRGAVRAARRLGRIDLVVGTTAPPQGGDIARRIAARCGCPYVYAVLDLYPDLAAALGRTKEGGFVCRRWHARDMRNMREAAAVVSLADRMTERIAQTRGVEPDKLHTIHDGFDPARIEPVTRNTFRSRYNPDGMFVVQYAGNMGLSHPFDTILASAQALADDPQILFQFVGDGPQRPYLEANLPPGAQLIDYQPADRLGQVLATADICLISQHEGMFDKSLPYKIYAILAAARACIFVGSRQSEIAGWLDQSGAGVQVDQGDTEKLTRAIRDLKFDPARRGEIGRAARSFLDDRFLSRQAAQQWCDLIGQLLGDPAAVPGKVGA